MVDGSPSRSRRRRCVTRWATLCHTLSLCQFQHFSRDVQQSLICILRSPRHMPSRPASRQWPSAIAGFGTVDCRCERLQLEVCAAPLLAGVRLSELAAAHGRRFLFESSVMDGVARLFDSGKALQIKLKPREGCLRRLLRPNPQP